MAEVKVYDPSEVLVLLFMIPVSGFGEDDMIEFDEDEDGFTDITGADGDITVTKNMSVKGTLNLTLMQTSQANAVLSAIYEQDRLNSGGAGLGPVMIKDNNGTSLLSTDTARIVKKPVMKFSKTPQPRVWKIRLYNHVSFEGGT